MKKIIDIAYNKTHINFEKNILIQVGDINGDGNEYDDSDDYDKNNINYKDNNKQRHQQ